MQVIIIEWGIIKVLKLFGSVIVHWKSINEMYIASPLYKHNPDYFCWVSFTNFAAAIVYVTSVLCRGWEMDSYKSLQWRHNDHICVSNHQPRACLLNRLFRRRSRKTSKLRVTGLCVGNSPGPVNSPHKGPVTRKMFPFDDVIMWIDQYFCVCMIQTSGSRYGIALTVEHFL